MPSPANSTRKKSRHHCDFRREPGDYAHAGGLLLLAAASETGLLTHLSEALSTEQAATRPPLASRSVRVRQRLLLTLLFLGAVGLQRPWDLRGYTADGLALLTGRRRAYGYHYTEAFLSQVAAADGAEHLTDALARWTTQLWHGQEEASERPRSFPRGLVGRLSTILGCRALVLLHDADGHPLLATTHRGDQHLTRGLPSILACYEQATGKASRLCRIIVDREGMATEFLADLHADGRAVVTILRSNQYRDLTSFSQVGTFVPLSTNAQGQVLREVAPARMSVARPDHPGQRLDLQVALIRDLRRFTTRVPSGQEAALAPNESPWPQEDWHVIASPGVQMTPKLIPIVTTASTVDAVELAQTYTQRWSAQENVIKDYLRPLGLDVNHGFAKSPVENSEQSRRCTRVQQRVKHLKQRVQQTQERIAQTDKRRKRLALQLQRFVTVLGRQLRQDQETWKQEGMDEQEIKRRERKRHAFNYEQRDPFRAKDVQLCEQKILEQEKLARYHQQLQHAQRAEEALSFKERSMYELDHRKDQVMTICKVAMANLAMWVRDQYFPASYAHATWRRLVPFFQLPGTITCDGTTVHVCVHPFNDRALNRDLAILCTRLNEASPHLPDGRILRFTPSAHGRVLVAQNHHQIP